jgi:CelD/BcsL family acetyltransferase involved in cellulose biosynthesis
MNVSELPAPVLPEVSNLRVEAAPQPAAAGLRVELIERAEDLDALADEWRALAAQVPGATLFDTHDFVASCWRHFSTDTDRLFLVAVRQAGRLVALAPLRLGRERIHRIPVRVLTWIAMWEGDRPGLLTTLPLTEAWALVGEELVRRSSRWDLIRLREQPAELPLPASLRRRVQTLVSPDSEFHAIRLDMPFERYIEGLPSGVRQNWRRRWRKLFEQAPVAQVDHVRPGAAEVDAALDRFVAIERLGWKGDAGIGIGRNAQHRRFYADLLARLGPAQVSFYFLRHAGEDIGAKLILRHGEVAHSRHVTYAPDHAALSPGVTLQAEIVREMCGTGLREMDLSGMRASSGVTRHKTDWSTAQVMTWTHELHRRSGRLMLVVLARTLKHALRRSAGQARA